MRHSLMTEPLAPSDQFMMLHHHNTQPTASAAATLTTEFIHASLVAASHSSLNSSTTTAAAQVTSNNISSCPLRTATTNNSTTTTNNNNTSNMPSAAAPTTPRNARITNCVAGPKMSYTTLATLEYTIHTSPRRMTRDLATVFPNLDLSSLLVVPTFQKCKNEMVAWDAEIAKEKDDRLDDFVRWSTALHQRLERRGYWSDMTDPASGFPCFSERGRDVYPDVEGCQMLLKYDFQNAGCCKVLLHPVWGSKIYPATFFTTAPLEALEQVIQEVESEHAVQQQRP
ncbi:hypothetical protein EMPS_02813 [Entomortierella parvispora]|uniref:Methylmalonic aciduria and homocystinuria type D protein n=1 Tax=Entomortierella parvispora TaxID=205924 RepID=A0A9P3LU14_9FUNG|nr:hypothetical protein EMPS_02813 [Entomortierella parvispora]